MNRTTLVNNYQIISQSRETHNCTVLLLMKTLILFYIVCLLGLIHCMWALHFKSTRIPQLKAYKSEMVNIIILTMDPPTPTMI